MTRDIAERLSLYAREEILVRRIALTIDQVRQYNPPPSFIKITDSRSDGYREQFGTEECWELDALNPTVIANLIRAELDVLIEPEAWGRALADEKRGRRQLAAMAANWTKVRKMLGDKS
jgi:hypothetical protein